MPDQTRIIRAVMTIRQLEPELWAELCAAMRDYSVAVTTEFIRCSPELLSRAQGMAIQAAELATIFEQAPTLHEKMGQMKNGRRPNSSGTWQG